MKKCKFCKQEIISDDPRREYCDTPKNECRYAANQMRYFIKLKKNRKRKLGQ
jgi:hypothetical protein